MKMVVYYVMMITVILSSIKNAIKKLIIVRPILVQVNVNYAKKIDILIHLILKLLASVNAHKVT